MSTELFWMTLTILMTSLFWLAYVLNRIAVRGLMRTLDSSKAEVCDDLSPWAQRAAAAHRNAVENLVLFAPAVLLLAHLGISTGITQTAAAIYFFARLAHYFVYAAGIPAARTLCFAVGWASTFALLLTALAAANNFHALLVNAKALRVCALCNGVADRWLLQLYGGIAVLADKEMPGVAMSWVSAADKGVQ